MRIIGGAPAMFNQLAHLKRQESDSDFLPTDVFSLHQETDMGCAGGRGAVLAQCSLGS